MSRSTPAARGEKHDFNAPAYTTLKAAWEAGSSGNFTGAQSFIFGEMMKNKDAATVKVAPNREWDHKPTLAERYGLETLNETYLKDPKGNRAVSYDIWSNIHYGYVGRAAGISRWELENGAQVPIIAGNTDAGDKITVRVGMDIYDKYGPNLTPQQFQQEVDKTIQEMEQKKTPQVKQWPSRSHRGQGQSRACSPSRMNMLSCGKRLPCGRAPQYREQAFMNERSRRL